MNNNDMFVLAKGERDGLPYFATVIKGFRDYKKKDSLPWLLEIKTYFPNSTEVGLVPNEESDELYFFEDFLKSKLNEVAETYFVTRITWNNIRSLYFYVSDPKAIADQLNKLIEQGQHSFEFEYRIEKDNEWKKMAEIIPNIENI